MSRIHHVVTRVPVAMLAWLATLATASAQAPVQGGPAAMRESPSLQAPQGFQSRTPRPDRGRWMLEVHGASFGSLLDSSTTATTVDAFPTGASFTTAGSRPSRAVSSWAFGDGPVLFDEVRRAFATEHGVILPSIRPLDGVMRSSGVSSTPAKAVGGRLSGNLTSWLALEVAVDRGSRRWRLTDDTVAAVEATRASYAAAFETLLTTMPQTNSRVTATATTSPEVSGNQTIATGSLVLALVRTSRLGIHASFGGGIIRNDDATLEAKLAANYQFRIINTYQINESDTVSIRFTQKKQVPVGVAGLGFTLRLLGRTGLRVDARMLANENTSTTTVNASASRVTATPAVSFPSLTTPSIQFSNAAGARTSLSGDPVSGLETYRGRGYELRPQFTVGYYVRF